MVLIHGDGNLKINSGRLVALENGDYLELRSTSFVRQILQVLEVQNSKRILCLIAYNLAIIYFSREWVISTNSIGLNAYANTIFFNVFALVVCLISIWVEQNSPANRSFGESIHEAPRPSNFAVHPGYPNHLRSVYSDHKDEKKIFDRGTITSLGLEKYEVLALLVSSCFSLMASFLISIRALERLVDQPKIHTEGLGLGIFLGFLAHLGTIIGYPDAGLNHVVCNALPCPTLRGCNPILGGNTMSALILGCAHLAVYFWKIHTIDTVAAFAIIFLTTASMLPLAFFTFNVILQKLPWYMCEQLDKCLREALIIDGVLEFRNERFWTKSFGKLAGTLQVRVRRNANENHVLECVMLRLSKIVSTLSIQEFHESGKNDLTKSHYPTEYYVNEILWSRDELNSDTTFFTSERKLRNDQANSQILKIEDLFECDTLAVNTTDEKFTKIQNNKNVIYDKSMRKWSIIKNEELEIKDRLWRGDIIKTNALLHGAKFDLSKFEIFY